MDVTAEGGPVCIQLVFLFLVPMGEEEDMTADDHPSDHAHGNQNVPAVALPVLIDPLQDFGHGLALLQGFRHDIRGDIHKVGFRIPRGRIRVAQVDHNLLELILFGDEASTGVVHDVLGGSKLEFIDTGHQHVDQFLSFQIKHWVTYATVIIYKPSWAIGRERNL